MIIFDSSNFTVVFEPSSIVCGSSNQLSLQLASITLQGISSQLSSPIKINNLVTNGNQDVSVSVGSFTTNLAGEPVQGAIYVSSVVS
jgi:hypothetical protein